MQQTVTQTLLLEKSITVDEKRAESLARIAHAELLGHVLAYTDEKDRDVLLSEEKKKLKLENEIEILKLEILKKQLQNELQKP
jgi:hypothetical protein